MKLLSDEKSSTLPWILVYGIWGAVFTTGCRAGSSSSYRVGMNVKEIGTLNPGRYTAQRSIDSLPDLRKASAITKSGFNGDVKFLKWGESIGTATIINGRLISKTMASANIPARVLALGTPLAQIAAQLPSDVDGRLVAKNGVYFSLELPRDEGKLRDFSGWLRGGDRFRRWELRLEKGIVTSISSRETMR